MVSRSMLTLYTILIVVLVLILFLLVLALVLFRDTLVDCCCAWGFRRRDGLPLISGVASGETPSGLRNPGFDDLESPRRMPEQRPFDLMEQVESPPSYDEAVRQELFRFQPLSPARTSRSHTSSSDIDTEEAEDTHPQTNPSSSRDTTISTASASYDHNLPTTSHGQTSRKKPGIAAATQLPTINEDDQDDRPVTVVIDCIGVQAARLMEHCETTVKLEDGSELRTYSKC